MAEENGLTSTATPVEAPRGFFSARVDEKGRLKLPAAITQYLGALGENKVFVTTLNGSTARIYPISAWRQTENVLEEAGEDADVAGGCRVCCVPLRGGFRDRSAGARVGSDGIAAGFEARKRAGLSALFQAADRCHWARGLRAAAGEGDGRARRESAGAREEGTAVTAMYGCRAQRCRADSGTIR